MKNEVRGVVGGTTVKTAVLPYSASRMERPLPRRSPTPRNFEDAVCHACGGAR